MVRENLVPLPAMSGRRALALQLLPGRGSAEGRDLLPTAGRRLLIRRPASVRSGGGPRQALLLLDNVPGGGGIGRRRSLRPCRLCEQGPRPGPLVPALG